MHTEVFSIEQQALLPWVKQFRREFYLVGGTAIALYIGHRMSIDFDLFKLGALSPKKYADRITRSGFAAQMIYRETNQLHYLVNGVKVTFFQYPYSISVTQDAEGVFRLPALLDLAAMKAFALGRRSKWKDYVDLYFLLNNHFTIAQISQRATEIFGELFSEKMFRAQLSFFDDVDYTEQVDWLLATPPTDAQIREKLTEIAVKV